MANPFKSLFKRIADALAPKKKSSGSEPKSGTAEGKSEIKSSTEKQ